MHGRLRSILGALGYTEEVLSFASNLAEAKALLAAQPFAMAFVDIGLPDGNGVDLIGEMHRNDRALPILVISAWSDEQIILRALQAGASGYLLKERSEEHTSELQSLMRTSYAVFC